MYTRYSSRLPIGRLGAAVGVVLCAYLIARALCVTHVPDDLVVYQGATRQWLAGGDLYGFHRPNGDGFTYPPAAAALLLWTAALPDQTLVIVWTTLTVGVCALAAGLLARHGAASAAQAFVLLLIAAPGRSNLDFGQVSVFVFVLTLMDAAWVPARARGWLTGVAAAVKLTPVLFLAMFAVRRQWAELGRGVAAVVALCGVAALVDPGATRAYISRELLTVSEVADWSAPGNQSLRATLARLGFDGSGWLLVSVFLVAVVLTWTARRRHRALELVDWCVVGAAITLVSPISWTHHRFWLLVPLLLPVWRGRSRAVLRSVLLLVAFVGPMEWWPLREAGVLAAVTTVVVLIHPPSTRHPNVAPPRDRIEAWQR